MWDSWLEFILWVGAWGSLFGAAYYCWKAVKGNLE